MLKTLFLSISFFLLATCLIAQTNPQPQNLPYSQNFSTLPYTSTSYPVGTQGWLISSTPGSSFNTSAPTADRSMLASSDASKTTGSFHNYREKIGFLNSNIADHGFAVAINTTGKRDIMVNYSVMTIRNPYDGSANTRINEVTLQYRVGISGSFTNLNGIEYQNNTTQQTSSTTTPQNLVNESITLPIECNNQSVVQLRFASREVSGSGNRPSFAFDNISITGNDIPLPVELSAFTILPDHQNHPRLTWVTQSETGVVGFHVLRAEDKDLSVAQIVSPLIPATNTAQQQTYSYTDADLHTTDLYFYWLQSSDLDGSSAFHGPLSFYFDSSGNGSAPEIPLQTSLGPIYPNPFNPIAFIPFYLATPAEVEIQVYDSRGQLVRRLDLGVQQSGAQRLNWDGKDGQGRDLGSGIYCVTLHAGKDSLRCKAMLLK